MDSGNAAQPASHDDPAPALDRQPATTVTEITVSMKTLWRIVFVVALAATLFWALSEARHFVSMLVVSLFFSLALLPAVNHIHERYGWKRGAAVGVIYLGGLVFVALLIAVLIPSIAKLGENIASNGGTWLKNANDWLSTHLGLNLYNDKQASDAATKTADSILKWSQNSFGKILGIASTGVGFLFNLATIAMFTFYFTADFGRMRRYFLSFYRPETQQRLGWTIDEAIRQTGGYFYTRVLLMGVAGTGFFLSLVIVGVPIPLALALGLFGGFVSEFIPAIGTYIGAAIPAAVALALTGIVGALVIVVYAVVYQQLENYVLSPRLSAKTMNLNGAVAFGSALAGGALFGPMGAFMALPVAALTTSIVNNYTKRYEVVFDSGYDDQPDSDDRTADRPSRQRADSADRDDPSKGAQR